MYCTCTVQVQHRQLGVNGLLGVKLLGTDKGYLYMRRETGPMMLTFGGRSTVHAPVVMPLTFGRRSTAHAQLLIHNHYITPPRLLVPGSKVYTRQNYGKQK